MVTKLDISTDSIPAYRVEGSLSGSDYDTMIPEVERMIETTGKFSLYIELVNFHGWSDLGGLFKEFKFDAGHAKHIQKCALVGEGKLIELATKASNLVMGGDIRFSPHGEEKAAQEFVGL